MSTAFTIEESARLRAILAEDHDAGWHTVAARLGTGRTSEACRKHARIERMDYRFRRSQLPPQPPLLPWILPPADPPAPAAEPKADAYAALDAALAAARAEGRAEVLDALRGLLSRLGA